MHHSTWIAASGGDWDTLSNWNVFPTGSHAATIDTAAAAEIDHAMNASDVAGSLRMGGSDLLSVSAGSLTIAGAATLKGGAQLLGGILSFDGATSIAHDFQQTGGTLGGTGTITLSGPTLFDGGEQIKTGATVLRGATTVGHVGEPDPSLLIADGRVLRNEGTLSWVGGLIFVERLGVDGATVDNAVGGVFDCQFDGVFRLVNGSGAFTNEGVFNKTASLGTTYMDIGFDNTGTVDVEMGTLDFQDAVTQYATGTTTLTGGTWIVGPSATLEFASGSSGILVNDADVTLDGAGSVFTLIKSLATNNGALRLLDGRAFAASGGFTNAGVVQLAGGRFSAPSLANSGSVTGFGALGATIVNTGTLTAAGGALDLVDPVSGAGALRIAAGATLEADQAVASQQNLAFKGSAGVLALGEADTFAATIKAFASGDAIDLLATEATSAVLGPSDTLVITAGGTTVAILQLGGNYSGDSFSVASDGHGGTNITISTGQATPPSAPERSFIAAMASLTSPANAPVNAGHRPSAPEPMLSVKPF